MKFKVDGKMLKNTIESVVKVVPKTSAFPSLRRLYFSAEDGRVVVFASDAEKFLKIKFDAEMDGVEGFALDVDDLKPFMAMKGDVTIERKDGMITIVQGKKKISVAGYSCLDGIRCPIPEGKELVLECREDDLYETFMGLVAFTTKDEINYALRTINFNAASKEAAACDSHRVAIRRMPGKYSGKGKDFMMQGDAVPVFKKVLDKNGKRKVRFFNAKNYIIIEGDDFEYAQKRLDCSFFDVSKMEIKDYDYHFNIDRKALLEQMNEIKSLNCASFKDPVIVLLEGNIIKTSYRNAQYGIEDELNVDDAKGEIRIGLNPYFVADACSIANTDILHCKGMNNKSPIQIEADDYKFIILPVNIG